MGVKTRTILIAAAIFAFFAIGIALDVWLIHTCGFWKTVMMGDRAGLMALSGYCE
jgi:hypothetical protein